MRYVLLSLLFAFACSDDTKPLSCAMPGGPVAGAADTHCGATVQPTLASSCHPMNVDAGATDDGGMGGAEFGMTMFGTEGDDDDCKYHVKWSALTQVCENGDVFFSVTATKKSDGSALTGAMPTAEVFLNDTHPAPNSNQTFVENPPGTYKIGPIRFDAAGQWTVRYHFFQDCEDLLETSPHGHAAFFVEVP